MDAKKRISEIIKKHLQGVSVRKLSEQWGISHTALQAWVNEDRLPDPEYLELISDKTGYSVDYLLNGYSVARPFQVANQAIQEIDKAEELFKLQEQIMFRIRENLGQYNLAS